ncbi:hypothetical protein GCM10010206_66330 [Streptomyces cinerochromogenes]|nr:hypothetical protein GCM10010206_66330 [Streptomyces cinerochromogenes]
MRSLLVTAGQHTSTRSCYELSGLPNIKALGKLRYVVEQTFSLLHQFKRLAVRWERRLDLHDALVSCA